MPKDEIIILDTPDQIQAFFMLQIYHKLKLEVTHPDGPKWRGSPMQSAQEYLRQAGINPKGRKATVLDQYEKHLKDIGVLT